MIDEKASSSHGQSDQDIGLKETHYQFIVHLCNQNKARASYLSNIDFGEPIWDFLLDLLASEYLDRPSSIADMAQRIGINEAICKRCAAYLLQRAAIFENRNQHTKARFPWLISEETKVQTRKWVNDCMSEASKSGESITFPAKN